MVRRVYESRHKVASSLYRKEKRFQAFLNGSEIIYEILTRMYKNIGEILELYWKRLKQIKKPYVAYSEQTRGID